MVLINGQHDRHGDELQEKQGEQGRRGSSEAMHCGTALLFFSESEGEQEKKNEQEKQRDTK